MTTNSSSGTERVQLVQCTSSERIKSSSYFGCVQEIVDVLFGVQDWQVAAETLALIMGLWLV